MKKLIFSLTLTLSLGLSGCATYDAISGKDSTGTANRVDAIADAAQADLRSIAPVVGAFNPIAGIGVEVAAGAVAVLAALFGAKERRNAGATRSALDTVVQAIEKAEQLDPNLIRKLKDSISRKSTANGTAVPIVKAVDRVTG